MRRELEHDGPTPERGVRLRALARSAGGARVVSSGRSMEPTLRSPTPVRVRFAARPRVGDVVLFASASDPERFILHRVALNLPGTPWFVHAGDAAGVGIARRDAIIGRAELPRRWPGSRAYLRAAVRLGRHLLRRAS